MRRWKLAAVLLCIILGLGAAGCGESGEDGNTDTTQAAGGTDSIWDQEPVVHLGDIEISYRELMIYLQSTRQEYEDQYGSEIWDYVLDEDGMTVWDFVKEMTLEQLIYLKIVCAQAEELGVSLTEDEVMDVLDYTADYIDHFTEDELEYYGITVEIVQNIYSENLLAEKIYETVTLRADTDVPDEEARQVKVWQIYVQTAGFDEEGNQLNLTEEELDEKRQKAEELLAGAREAEDFLTYAQTNSEDTSEIEVIFGQGDRDDAIVTAAFALAAGEISDLIETEDGYYILYCVEETDEVATAEKKEEIIAERQKALFEEYYEEWSAAYTITVNDEVWELVTLDPNAAAVEAETEGESETQGSSEG